MEKIIFKFNGETATKSIQANEKPWEIIAEMLYILWELRPAERNWERKAVRENFALFDYCGIIHDVFAFQENKTMTVFIAEE